MNLLKIKEISQEKGIALRLLAIKAEMTEQNLHRCIKSNKITANDLEKIADVLEVPVDTFFDEKHFTNNQQGNVNNGTVVQSRDGNVSIQSGTENEELKIINESLQTRIDDYETKLLYYWQFISSFTDYITEIYVTLAEKDSDIKDTISKIKETDRIIAIINTLVKMSDKKIIYNKKFFEYYENPY